MDVNSPAAAEWSDMMRQISAKDHEIAKLRAALQESYEENLYNAIHEGVAGNGGKWWPGGMSDAEWFCRKAEIGYEPQFTKEELLARVPEIAKSLVDEQQGEGGS